MLHLVKSDAEISPPLYFVLAWLATQLGSAAELVRLPALIAGLASIPLAFLLGRRLFGQSAGLVAAAIMALNPFMVFYATDGRAYTVAIALLLGSTLAMLIAADGGGWGWWAAYAALVALAMYAHYTAAFVLGAQLLWLLWARPQARVAGLVATGVAAIAYLPWVPGAIDDSRSPTVDVLSALQGNGVRVKLDAIGNWAFGYPFNQTDHLPGRAFFVIGILAVVALTVGAGLRLLTQLGDRSQGWRSERVEAFVLAILIAIATPVAEAAILAAGGTDLFGARNLNTATGGFAVLLGGMAAEAAVPLAIAAVGALLAVFAIGTVKSLDAANSTIDFKDAAVFINGGATPRDAVVDLASTQFSPAPTTPVSSYLSTSHRLFNVYQPTGPPPFLHPCPPRRPILMRAQAAASHGRLFVVGAQGLVNGTPRGVSITLPGSSICIAHNGQEQFSAATYELPGWRLTGTRQFRGIGTVVVYVLRAPQAAAG